MNSTADNSAASPGRSWRNIRQDVSAPAMSRRGRRRQIYSWMKIGALSALGLGAAWGAYVVVHSWGNDRAALATAVRSAPVREVALITNGVLHQKWVNDALALPQGATLMSLDLPALRDRLLRSGQVRAATLSRNFPDVLVVTVEERTPVAGVRVENDAGGLRQLLVAKDGVVYEGVNYDREMLLTLPWLDVAKIVRVGDGYEPIEGMADVAALLSMAQLETPALYRDWRVVSLKRLAARDEIVVTTQGIPEMEITFSRTRDYYKQLARLDYLVETVPSLLAVDLSQEDQVPVRLTSSPGELAKGSAPSAQPFQLNTPQLKGKRDL